MTTRTAGKTIMTRNITPGKQGARLSVEKYEAVKAALLKIVPPTGQGIALSDVPSKVAKLIPREFLSPSGSATWLVMTVKLDLEARGQLERVPNVTPQRLRRVK